MNNFHDALLKDLAEFDGKALSLLGELKARHGHDPKFIPTLIDLMVDTNELVASGTTWLVKNMLETGEQLANKDANAFVQAMPKLKGWQAHLHASQSLQYLPKEALKDPTLGSWLTGLCQSERPFLRAWATDGLVRVCLANPHCNELLEQATKAIAAALNDDAGSVRARARKLEQLLGR